MIDFDASELHGDDGPIRLSPTEWRLLRCLASRLGATVAREELLREVWEEDADVAPRVVDTTVRRLRARLEENPSAPRHLLSVYREGYRLEASPEAVDARPRPAATPPLADGDGLHGPRRGLPPVGSPILGRDALIAELVERLAGPEHIVTLVGPAGVGKTRLAVAVAEAIRASAVVGGAAAWFCDLRSAHDDADVIARVAAQLEAPRLVLADGASLATEAGTRGPAVLVIDNADQMIAARSDLLARLVGGAPDLRVIVTSRLTPTPGCGAAVTVPPLSTAAAVELFERRAGRGWPPGALDELVTRLDRLPLAVELAADRAAMLSPRQLVERLERRFELLRDPFGEDSPGRASLRSALDVSWNLLAPLDREVLAQCGVFEAPFTVAAAEAVVTVDAPPGAVLDALQRLVAHSLVSAATCANGSGEHRLRLLDSIRDYATERLDELAIDPARLRAAHARYFVDRARDAVEGIRIGADHGALRQLARDADDLRAIVGRADAEAPADVAWACMALSESHCASGPREVALAFADDAVAWAERAGTAALRAEARCTRAVVSYLLRARRIDDEVEPILDLARESGDNRLVVRLLLQALVAMETAGRADDAVAAAAEALALAERDRYAAGVARAEAFTAWLLLRHERLEDSAAWVDRALRSYTRLGPSRGHALALNTHALICLQRALISDAWRSIDAAEAMSRDVGYHPGEMVSVSMGATALMLSGRYDDARARLDTCVAAARTSGRAVAVANALCSRALCDVALGQPEPPLDDLREAEAIALANRDRLLLRRVSCVTAVAHLAAGDATAARAALDPAREGATRNDADGIAGLVERVQSALDSQVERTPLGTGQPVVWEARVIERILERLAPSRRPEGAGSSDGR